MEEGVYYFIAHNIVSIGMLLRHGLERRLSDEDYQKVFASFVDFWMLKNLNSDS